MAETAKTPITQYFRTTPLILIVGNNHTQRVTARACLEICGYHISEAETIQAALDNAKQTPPDLILMDAEIAALDNFAVFQKLRALTKFETAPILVAVPIQDEKTAEKALQAGAADLIVTPFNLPVLENRILNLLKNRQIENRFLSYAHTTPDGIITTDEEGIILFVNEAVIAMFGTTAQELMGVNATTLIPDYFTDLHQETLSQYIATRKPNFSGETVELIGLRKNGEEFPIQLSLTIAEIENQLQFTAIVRDLTLQKKKEFTSQLLQHITKDILSANSSGEIAYAALEGLHKALNLAYASVIFFDKDNQNAWVKACISGEHICPCHREVFPIHHIQDIMEKIEKGQPRSFEDLSRQSNLDEYLHSLHQHGIQSTFHYPLISQGKVFGCTNLSHFKAHAFSQEDQIIAGEAITSMAVALENNRLMEEAEHRAEIMTKLAHIGEDFNRTFTLEKVIEVIGKGGMDLSGCDRAAIYLRVADQTATCPWSENISKDYIQSVLGQLKQVPGGKLMEQTSPILISNINALPENSVLRQLARKEGVQAIALWPLIYKEQVIAAFASYYNTPHNWSKAEQDGLAAFTRQAAIVYENVQLNQRERQYNLELASLYRASDALLSNTSPHLAHLAQTIVETILVEFEHSNCSLFLVDPNENALTRIAVAGPYSQEVSKSMLYLDGSGVVPAAIRSGEIINVPDVNQSAYYMPNWGDSRSELAIPLKDGDKVIGAIDIQHSEINSFSDGDVRVMSSFADQASMAILKSMLIQETQNQANALQTVNQQLHDLNVSLEDRVRQRTYELQVLHELSQEISYTLEYEDLFQQMLNHLYRIVDYDIAVSLLIEDGAPKLYQRLSRPVPPLVAREIQNKLISTFNRMQGVTFGKRDTVTIHNLKNLEDLPAAAEDTPPVNKFNSNFQVPLISRVGNELIGLIYIGSAKENAFTEDSVRLLYTLATQASVIIERLRTLIDVEQQRLESLVEHIPEGLVLLDKNKNIVLANPSGKKYFDQIANIQFGQRLSNLGGVNIETFLSRNKTGLPHEVSIEEHNTRQIFEVESQAIEAGPEAGSWALIIRDVTRERELLHSEQERREELSILYNFSRQLVTTDEKDEVFYSIVYNAVHSLEISFSRLLIQDRSGLHCQAAYQMDGSKLELAPCAASEAVHEIYTRVLEKNRGVTIDQNTPGLSAEDLHSLMLDKVPQLYLAPLIIGEEQIGILELGASPKEDNSLTQDDKKLIIEAFADQSASAIHRALLHEQTEQRLRRLTALRQIDLAISSNIELDMTLSILLEQIKSELNIDAAAILLYNQHTQYLEMVRSSGFRTAGYENITLRLNEGLAGKAAFRRKTVFIPDLTQVKLDPSFRKCIAGEDFTTYYGLSLIVKGGIKGVLEIFNRTPVQTNAEWVAFLETLAGQTAIAVDNAQMFEGLQRSAMEIMLAYDATIEGWARALELRDYETVGHSKRVTKMTETLARAMGIQDENLVNIRRGALLHDIGKMGVPDSILHKPGKLNEEEWEIIRKHPVYAYDMLSSIDFLKPAMDIPHYHHERWDGSGYPKGLKGTDIPLPARIFAIVDAWDALSSDRPYRKAWEAERVIAYLKTEAGALFDPEIVDTFLQVLKNQT